MNYKDKTKNDLIKELEELKEKYDSLVTSNAKEIENLNAEFKIINQELYVAKITAEENEERYKRIINGITGYIYTVKVVDGVPTETYHNEACIAVTGYSAWEFEQDPYLWINMVVAEEKDLVAESFLKLLEGKDIHSIEHRIIHKNGSTRWVSNILIPKHDSLGTLISYDGIITDITDRKLAELALKIRESYLSAILENQPGLVWLKDLNSRFIYVNNVFAKSLGIDSPTSLVGKNDYDICPPDQARKYIEDDLNVIKTGNPFVGEEILTITSGDFWSETHKRAIYDDHGNIIGTTGFAYDITDRKRYELLLKEKTEEIESQNEEYLQINEELNKTNQDLLLAKERAEESDRLKTAFLQNMSHEIRTPMNAIMGFSDLIKDYYENKAKLFAFSDIIKQRCNDLLDIINDILDIAKIESGQLPVSFEEFELKELFNELAGFFAEYQKRIGKGNIQLNINLPDDSEYITIITDKVKLKQIFINLLSNAFKFTDEGVIEFGIKSDKNNNNLFYVTDTGIGIPLNKQMVIFERFTQLQQRPGRNISGTGLGLPIVKGLVAALGGEINLESEPGKGSTFSFTIQLKTSKTNNQVTAPVEQNNKGFKNNTILIVEDDFYNTEYLKEILTGKGLKIIYADNAADAVNIAVNQPVDLVLMDVRLPDIDGYEATKQILQNKPGVKIIAQTAYATVDERPRALLAGCIDYISKPTEKKNLINMLKKYLPDI